MEALGFDDVGSGEASDESWIELCPSTPADTAESQAQADGWCRHVTSVPSTPWTRNAVGIIQTLDSIYSRSQMSCRLGRFSTCLSATGSADTCFCTVYVQINSIKNLRRLLFKI